jgi:hypothetical protein
MNQKWIVANYPTGPVQTDDLTYTSSLLPPLAENMIRVRTIYLSIDPTNRVWLLKKDTYLPSIELGDVMRGVCIGKVEESNHSHYKPGDLVQGMWGWQTYHISNGDDLIPLPILPALPLTAHFGLLGHVGISAWYGMLEIGKPSAGETVVISAASGAVGSLAGQIAKMQGARVVGIAGSEEKCRRITQDLHFDSAINYTKESVAESLKKHCPNGIDVYFDNVGGQLLDTVLESINDFGRIVACGMISMYNYPNQGITFTNLGNLVMRRVLLKGFICLDHWEYAEQVYTDLIKWHQQGKLHYQVDVVHGLENAPSALQMLFDGANKGKLMIKVSEENE